MPSIQRIHTGNRGWMSIDGFPVMPNGVWTFPGYQVHDCVGHALGK